MTTISAYPARDAPVRGQDRRVEPLPARLITAGVETPGEISDKTALIGLVQRLFPDSYDRGWPWIVAAVLENVPPEMIHAAIDPSMHESEAGQNLARAMTRNIVQSAVVPAPLNATASRIAALPENRRWIGRPSFGGDANRAPGREVPARDLLGSSPCRGSGHCRRLLPHPVASSPRLVAEASGGVAGSRSVKRWFSAARWLSTRRCAPGRSTRA